MMIISYRSAVSIRRALVLLAVGMIFIAFLRTNYYLSILSAMPVIIMVFTDTCKNCGSVLFFQRGDTLGTWLNPLYVPRKCKNCHEIIGQASNV